MMNRTVRAIAIISLGLHVSGCTETQTPNHEPTSAAKSDTAPIASSPGVPSGQQDSGLPANRPSTRPSVDIRPLSPSMAVTPPTKSTPITESVTPGRSRMADGRTPLNSLRLERAGLRQYSGRRLVLVTDVDSPDMAALPSLADRLYEQLIRHFGPLPDAQDGSDFQVTGYLISDIKKFQSAALLPSESFTFEHGKHVGYEFWFFEQKDAYYRRHLLLHEFVHCFMLCENRGNDLPALWYVEGMAEYFATHALPNQFAVLPSNFADFNGWGRITDIRKGQRKNNGEHEPTLTLPGFAQATQPGNVFAADRYSSSWAACWFLHNHPEYQSAMKPLAQTRKRNDFQSAFGNAVQTCGPKLAVDWLLFCETVQHGFDPTRSWPQHSQIRPAATADVRVQADQDWQDSGILVKKNDRLTLTSMGRFQIKHEDTPWISESHGVTIEYVNRHPLGQLVAIIVAEDGSTLTDRIAIGAQSTVGAPITGRLWLQLNDHSGQRSDNQGHVVVTVKR